MAIDRLTERQVIGTFFKALEQDLGASWIPGLTNYFTSDQASEEYAWLGMPPAMREWVGGRNAKGFRENGLTIANKHYESTIDILVRHLRRDKSGQAMLRIQEMADRANAHWASLVSTLIINAAATVCYDGQYFFDTDHSEGDSGSQSNDITVTLSGIPVETDGTSTAPSVSAMQYCIAQAIGQIASFKDDQGEPMNENAQSFLVMIPPVFMNATLQAVQTPVQAAETQTALVALQNKFKIDVAVNVRLAADWTTNFAVFRTDGRVKSFIRQEETGITLKVKGDDSDYCFDNDAWQIGIDTWRNVGYGLWQNSCLVTMA